MDLEIIILCEISQTAKDKYHITYLWDLRKMVQGICWHSSAEGFVPSLPLLGSVPRQETKFLQGCGQKEKK